MAMTSTTARRLAVLYVLMGLPAWFHLMYVPNRLVVRGDAAATARNIEAAEPLYRLGILSGLVSGVFFLFLAVALYELFRDVDRRQARLLVVLVSTSVVVGLFTLILQAAPLVFGSGAHFLSVFPKPQLDALSFGFLRLNALATHVNMAFWGLWLLPFGLLVRKSGFVPRLIGTLLVVGCFAYLAVSVTYLLFPAQRNLVNQVAFPFYAIGELSMIGWLLFRAVRRATVAAPIQEHP